MSDKVLASCTGTIGVSQKGEKGAIERPRNWDNISDGSILQSGTGSERYIDIVLYGTEWYQCIKSFTKGDGILPTNTIYFTKITDYQRLATNLFLAKTAYIENLGVMNIKITDDGTENGNVLLQADKDGIVCNSGTFSNITAKDATIEGTLRSKYVEVSKERDELSVADNINIKTQESLTFFSLRWTADMVGRTIRISNGTPNDISITAPDGKYFLVDSVQNSSLDMNPYSCAILHGYGYEGDFIYWIVENSYAYAFRNTANATDSDGNVPSTFESLPITPMPILVRGTVTVTGDSESTIGTNIIYNRTAGKVTVSRLGTGKYRILLPESWCVYLRNIVESYPEKHIIAMATARGDSLTLTSDFTVSYNNPCFATVMGIKWVTARQIGIDVWTSTISGVQDSYFNFMIGLRIGINALDLWDY